MLSTGWSYSGNDIALILPAPVASYPPHDRALWSFKVSSKVPCIQILFVWWFIIRWQLSLPFSFIQQTPTNFSYFYHSGTMASQPLSSRGESGEMYQNITQIARQKECKYLSMTRTAKIQVKPSARQKSQENKDALGRIKVTKKIINKTRSHVYSR